MNKNPMAYIFVGDIPLKNKNNSCIPFQLS